MAFQYNNNIIQGIIDYSKWSPIFFGRPFLYAKTITHYNMSIDYYTKCIE